MQHPQSLVHSLTPHLTMTTHNDEAECSKAKQESYAIAPCWLAAPTSLEAFPGIKMGGEGPEFGSSSATLVACVSALKID